MIGDGVFAVKEKGLSPLHIPLAVKPRTPDQEEATFPLMFGSIQSIHIFLLHLGHK